MAYLNYITTKPGILKIGTLVIGVITLGIGCHSHFGSPWSENYTYVKEVCQQPNVTDGGEQCPDVSIGMEKFFIGIVIALFAFSLAHFFHLIFFKEMTEHYFRIFDIAYHVIGGILLIIGGALYIYSAIKVNEIDDLIEKTCSKRLELQYYEEKIIAGGAGLVSGLLYIGAGVLTFTSKDLSRISE